MSVRCNEPGCSRESRGSIGMLRYCVPCAASLFNWRRRDPRLRTRVEIDLAIDGHHIGRAEWVPDCAASRPEKGQ